MIWQDYVITVGSVNFLAALAPAIRAPQKPPLFTSALTGAWLALFALIYATLGLVFSCVVTALMASAWAIIAAQTWRAKRPHDKRLTTT